MPINESAEVLAPLDTNVIFVLLARILVPLAGNHRGCTLKSLHREEVQNATR